VLYNYIKMYGTKKHNFFMLPILRRASNAIPSTRLVTGLSPSRTGFDLRPVDVRLGVDKVVLRHILPGALRFPVSESLHKCSTLLLNLNNIQARRVGKHCEPPNKITPFQMAGTVWYKNTFMLFPCFQCLCWRVTNCTESLIKCRNVEQTCSQNFTKN